jgi:hypothetical protein
VDFRHSAPELNPVIAKLVIPGLTRNPAQPIVCLRFPGYPLSRVWRMQVCPSESIVDYQYQIQSFALSEFSGN